MIIFRYEEMVAKNGYDLIGKFDPKKVDLFGFTTYPDLQSYASPGDIAPDYYQPIRERVEDVPVAFTEIAWPTLPGDAQGGDHQVAFLRWFLRETMTMNVEMVIWPFLHDLAPPDQMAKRSAYLGLRNYDGRPKPAWALWQQLAALPRVE